MSTGGEIGCKLAVAERDRNYPDVAKLARLIDADTVFVVVKPELVRRLEAGETVPPRVLLGGSVQIRPDRVNKLALQPLSARPDLYRWPYGYDPQFLGYMQGALEILTGVAFLT
jgi:hypothetical protein